MAIHEQLRKILMHDFALPADRDPIGAICEGEAVTLRLRTRDEGILAAETVIFSDYGSDTVKMRRENDAFFATVGPFSRTGVYFYYFVLHHYGDTFYYGAPSDHSRTSGEQSSTLPAAFQITVYQRNFQTPAWFRKSVMYQIFPDRYAVGDAQAVEKGAAYHRALGRDIHLHASPQEPVDYLPRGNAPYYYPNDFYGGTLDAIRRGLPRLKALGIDVLYLNPIFEADSNHRYNTSDYRRIDPILGTQEDFTALCEAAQAQGIRIVLDGVFSHTGSDSVYFNRDGRYPDPGAYQGRESPYYAWYDFRHFPDDYRCWWGFESLPEVNEHDPSWQDFVITGCDSVVRTWLRAGAAGYRLDVADELPDDVLEQIRAAVKAEKPDGVVLGEVWEDPTTKLSYGVRRSYALGGSLDSVMNYPLRRAMLDFALGAGTAHTLCALLRSQRLQYPKPLYYSLMNLLSSHDVERVRSVLAAGMYGDGLTRQQQASFRISDAQDKTGAARQAMLAALQFSLPGVPCVYYGDEYGMAGFLDPFNRAFLNPHASEYPLDTLYARLAGLRHAHPALATGAISISALEKDVLCIVRANVNGCDVFGEAAPEECMVALINRADTHKYVTADIFREGCGFDGDLLAALRTAGYTSAQALLCTAQQSVLDGLFTVDLPPCSAQIYQLK